MDRSYLSQPEVIAASRAFVCVRLATYEDANEAKFLANLFTGQSGEVENTTFSILGPDGEERLSRADRSAHFSSARTMASAMNRIAAKFPATTKNGATPSLPKVDNVRLAINVAACDHQPLVILVGKDAGSLAHMEDDLRSLAWNDEFIGKFVFASTTDRKDLSAVQGVSENAKLVVVQPDEFGLKATVLASANGNMTIGEMTGALRDAVKLATNQSRQYGDHVRKGRELGKFWETKIPVTDPQEAHARRQKMPTPP